MMKKWNFYKDYTFTLEIGFLRKYKKCFKGSFEEKYFLNNLNKKASFNNF
jgi:hypothetical protein